METIDIEYARESFAIQSSLIFMKLEEILHKTKNIETQLIQTIRSEVSATDFYKPDPNMPVQPFKRMRIER